MGKRMVLRRYLCCRHHDLEADQYFEREVKHFCGRCAGAYTVWNIAKV